MPNGPPKNSNVEIITQTVPGTVPPLWAVPSNRRALIHAVSIGVLCDATVANRTMVLEFRDETATSFITLIPVVTMTANQQHQFFYAPHFSTAVTSKSYLTVNWHYMSSGLLCPMEAGWNVRCSGTNLQAGDSTTLIVMAELQVS